ncbi:L-threonylcarbamoyladenylate synthase [Urbifossiella limnaea]|uniref:L-threonylcarbamoyladenylate synthase n=1 Tax=Urbifossiella limnaea TaxID=2528023 RepID=UPI001EE42592|nr:L-threonylcarbamoyladenylate synthase [Urbifossiella limnaea]
MDPDNPDPALIERAAAVIRAGGLVAFPTETVYGLGANALDAAAVGRIFAAKGRPATNPVIVHVADVSDAVNVTAEWPATAGALAARFWPGPLTLVLPRGPAVPDVVTAGGPTVAVRCPAHPVARALIRAAGVPIAAPSANRSTELSPTRAEHVVKGLAGRIDLILDGGRCQGGIESTVVDMTGTRVRVLRPGLITSPMLEAVVGSIDSQREPSTSTIARSPGQMAKHYSPHTPVVLVAPGAEQRYGERVGLLQNMPDCPTAYAAVLYDRLHELDWEGYERIVIELPPDTADWAGVRDRLMRAAE